MRSRAVPLTMFLYNSSVIDAVIHAHGFSQVAGDVLPKPTTWNYWTSL